MGIILILLLSRGKKLWRQNLIIIIKINLHNRKIYNKNVNLSNAFKFKSIGLNCEEWGYKLTPLDLLHDMKLSWAYRRASSRLKTLLCFPNNFLRSTLHKVNNIPTWHTFPFSVSWPNTSTLRASRRAGKQCALPPPGGAHSTSNWARGAAEIGETINHGVYTSGRRPRSRFSTNRFFQSGIRSRALCELRGTRVVLGFVTEASLSVYN